MALTTIGIDADDTLWHDLRNFELTQERFGAMLAPFAESAAALARLEAIEAANLAVYGYGVKGFTLSMIETALDVTGGDVPGTLIETLLALGREMMGQEIEPLPGVEDALERLAARYRLVLVTKGDLFHQEQKLARSGLGDFFADVAIVSDKTAATYRRLFGEQGDEPNAAMVGNTLRSDILPAIEAGLWGVWVPYRITWAHEVAERPEAEPLLVECGDFAQAADWLLGR